jgi:hypothetical protein
MNKKVLIIGGVVLAAAVGGFLIYRNYKKKSGSKLPSDSTGSLDSSTTVATESKSDSTETVTTPEPKPAETKAAETKTPEVIKTPLVRGFQTFQDKLKAVAQAQNQTAPKVETYKSSKPFSVKKTMGIGMAIIPVGSPFQATLIQKIDDNTGLFQGLYNGITFSKVFAFADLQKV